MSTQNKSVLGKVGVSAALTGMDDAGDGGGDGQNEGGALDLNPDIGNAMLRSLTEERPEDKCYFKLLYYIHKLIRIFYVSFFFYFAPSSMLIYQYYVSYKKRMQN